VLAEAEAQNMYAVHVIQLRGLPGVAIALHTSPCSHRARRATRLQKPTVHRVHGGTACCPALAHAS